MTEPSPIVSSPNVSSTPTEGTPSRSPDGTLLDVSQTSTSPSTPATISTEPSPKPTESPAPKEGETLLTTDDKKPEEKAPLAGAPEKYTDFKLPEGIKLDGDQLTAAHALFKESGLSQDAAQRMVDFHTAQMKSAAEAPGAAYAAMRADWQTRAKADPEIGHILPKVKETLGRAYDALGDAPLVAEFKEAMNLTGVGDHPAFIKAFYRMAQRFTEGKHVAGGNPSPHGQRAPGATDAPSAAQALYPNLPSSGPQRG